MASQHQAAVLFFSTRIISEVVVRPELFSGLHHFWAGVGGGVCFVFSRYTELLTSLAERKRPSPFFSGTVRTRGAARLRKAAFGCKGLLPQLLMLGRIFFFPPRNKTKKKFFHRENCSHISQLDGGHSVFCNYFIILSRGKS